jgi:hypothetical protein
MQVSLAETYQDLEEEKATWTFSLKPLEADVTALNSSQLILRSFEIGYRNYRVSKFREKITEYANFEWQKSNF